MQYPNSPNRQKQSSYAKPISHPSPVKDGLSYKGALEKRSPPKKLGPHKMFQTKRFLFLVVVLLIWRNLLYFPTRCLETVEEEYYGREQTTQRPTLEPTIGASPFVGAGDNLAQKVISLDRLSVENALHTREGASSQLVAPKQTTLIKTLVAEPLFATIDQRPITIRRQLRIDPHHHRKSHRGCAMNTNTMVSHMHLANHSKFLPQHSKCQVCVDFLDIENAQTFASDIATSDNFTSCVHGRVRLHANGLNWEKERVLRVPLKHGYPYTLDCELPNGYIELTCHALTTRVAETVYVKTSFPLIYSGIEVSVESSWPWTALQADDIDENSWTALRDSDFVPSTPHAMKLAFSEGPSFARRTKNRLELMDMSNEANGGVNQMLAYSLQSQVHYAPNSTRILGVLDTQLNATRRGLAILLSSYQIGSQSLGIAMAEKGVRIVLVALSVRPLSFLYTIQAAQDAWCSYVAARYASSFQVIIAMDGDAVLQPGPGSERRTFQEMIYPRLYGDMNCHAQRFVLAEMYVHDQDAANSSLIFSCLRNVSMSEERWNQYELQCNRAYGNVVGRTDSVQSFDIHFVATDKDYLAPNVQMCKNYTNKNVSLFPKELIMEMHLTRKARDPECKCGI